MTINVEACTLGKAVSVSADTAFGRMREEGSKISIV
jgi:hypothetical protein